MEFFVVLFLVLGVFILKSAAERSVEKTPSEDEQAARRSVEKLKRRNGAPMRHAPLPSAGGRPVSGAFPAGGMARAEDFADGQSRGGFAKNFRKAPRRPENFSERERTAETLSYLPSGKAPSSDADLSAAPECLRSSPDFAGGGILDSEKSAEARKKSAAQRLGLDSPDSLKRAFVASEVLGRPKSLRNDWI